MLTYCSVQLKEHAKPFLEQFEREVVTFNEVVECYYIAGNFDYLLRVLVKDIAQYQNFLVNKLAALENIQNVQSMFVMTEVKWSTKTPL
jgi:DNA-binding Lrp family transcriptional regulator